ncbi:MAG: argininosuccinate synthase [Phycisphaeraceae bacterium]|nr:argininosuccinate synthase [Phycisphaeraceae bacterium]
MHGQGNDQVRFEGAYAALAPDMKIIAPWRSGTSAAGGPARVSCEAEHPDDGIAHEDLQPRQESVAICRTRGCGIEDPWNAPPEDAWTMTVSEQAPDKAEEVTVGIEKGRPVTLNGKHLAGEEMVAALNTIAGRHGVGRIDLVENRLVGMKSRGLYETPGGTVLVEAMRGVEHLVLDRETLHFREHLGLLFGEQVYNGRWFTPLREALWAAADIAQRLTGKVVVRLYKGSATAIRRQSDNSLYAEQYATFCRRGVQPEARRGIQPALASSGTHRRLAGASGGGGPLSQDSGGKPAAMWGGRFEGEADELFRAVNDSLGVDWELVQQDIRGSIAWAHALGGAGVLSADEVSKIEAALKELSREAAADSRLRCRAARRMFTRGSSRN